MKLYSQLSVNNILLEPAPFKMELVMEAFLVENPAVLSFDGDVIPEVLDYEIPFFITAEHYGRITERDTSTYWFNDELKLFEGTKIVVCSDWGTDFDKVVDALKKIKVKETNLEIYKQ